MEHVAHMVEMATVWLESLNRKDHLEDLGIDEKIIPQWILQQKGGRLQDGFFWFRKGTSEGSCKYNSEPLSSMDGRELLD
jgi:hypothetical protein